jgi:hypothetical protein
MHSDPSVQAGSLCYIEMPRVVSKKAVAPEVKLRTGFGKNRQAFPQKFGMTFRREILL